MIPNVADRAIAAEEIFGGTSEKLAGIINLTAAEFAALEANVVSTASIISEDGLATAKALGEAMVVLRGQVNKVQLALAPCPGPGSNRRDWTCSPRIRECR